MSRAVQSSRGGAWHPARSCCAVPWQPGWRPAVLCAYMACPRCCPTLAGSPDPISRTAARMWPLHNWAHLTSPGVGAQHQACHAQRAASASAAKQCDAGQNQHQRCRSSHAAPRGAPQRRLLAVGRHGWDGCVGMARQSRKQRLRLLRGLHRGVYAQTKPCCRISCDLGACRGALPPGAAVQLEATCCRTIL